MTGDDMKLKARLDLVFSKALDQTIDIITEEDIDECFGELKDQYGNSLQKFIINMLGSTQERMKTEYERACEKHRIETQLQRVSSDSDAITFRTIHDIHSQTDRLLNQTVNDLHAIEVFQLKEAVQRLETELQHNADKAAGLRIQIETTMAAAVEARDCLVHAASLLQP